MGIIDKLRASRSFQRLLRVFHFLSLLISLGLFTFRLIKIIRFTHLASVSNGTVEGILATSVAYTLAVRFLTFCLKHGAPNSVRWLLILLDRLFKGAFVAAAYLTRPNGGSIGPCKKSRYERFIPKHQNCNLPWGTFILAIVSSWAQNAHPQTREFADETTPKVLHALTAVFHEVRDHLDKNSRYGNHIHPSPAMTQDRHADFDGRGVHGWAKLHRIRVFDCQCNGLLRNGCH